MVDVVKSFFERKLIFPQNKKFEKIYSDAWMNLQQKCYFWKQQYTFVDDEGTKCVKQIILYSAITGQFIPWKRCQSAAEETDV